MLMNIPSIMLTLGFLFLFISFPAKAVFSTDIAFDEFMENESKVSYSRNTVQSAAVSPSSDNENEISSYSKYCSSVVPESVTDSVTFTKSFGPFNGYQTGYFNGGNGIVIPKIHRISNLFSFDIIYASKTVADGVYMIKGRLQGLLYLNLHGFWSEFSGKLCMVGMAGQWEDDGLLTPIAVLKLRNLKNSSNITTLITGTLESLCSSGTVNYFESISIIMFPQLKYEYTFDPRESVDEFSAESDSKQNLPFNVLPGRTFCSMLGGSANVYKLQYSNDCHSRKKNCLPFGGMSHYLPTFLHFSKIRCSEVQKRIQVLVTFIHVQNHLDFDPNTTLIGEGTWDDKKNQLFLYVCQFLNIKEHSWSNASIGDCTTRLILRFPAILSIRETSRAMGQIWTTKSVNDSGYFGRIIYRSSNINLKNYFDRIASRSTGYHLKGFPVPGMKYAYTEVDKVKSLCQRNELAKNNKGRRYPSAHSADMKFEIVVRDSEKMYGWGLAVPLAIGDLLYKQYLYPMALPNSMFEREVPVSWIHTSPINVSYVLSISYVFDEKIEITAEGIYDSETGKLCMVGCRKLVSRNQQVIENASMDCEILLNIQFPALEPNKNGGNVRGSIESTREKSDPLYFNRLDVSSAAHTPDQGRRSVHSIDPDILKYLMSNTLECIFVGLQIHHVKKNPKVLSFISLFMLLILNLGYMIPLALDSEALCSSKQDLDKVLTHGGKWFALNEVIVTLVTVAPFLLLLRLLQLTFFARSNDANNGKCLWFAEKMALLVVGTLYAAGAKFTLLFAWQKERPEAIFFSSSIEHRLYPFCNDLKSYADLLLDCFLLPQIFFNMVSNLNQKALSHSFYVGVTLVRLLPRAYDLYNSCGNVLYNIFHFSVNPDEDFLYAAWDVIMFLGILLLTAIIYFQQKFGGQCIIPSRFRD